MDSHFDVFDLVCILYWVCSRGCVVFSGAVVFFIEGSRYVGLVLFEEGLDLFSPLVESSFQPLVILLVVAELSFRPPLVMTNDCVGYHGRFNL